jgi:hypothetical protein
MPFVTLVPALVRARLDSVARGRPIPTPPLWHTRLRVVVKEWLSDCASHQGRRPGGRRTRPSICPSYCGGSLFSTSRLHHRKYAPNASPINRAE